jgi:hypothetical protein
MTPENVREGFVQLGELAQSEYQQTLAQIAEDGDAQRAAMRVGRLIGVEMKKPFAVPTTLTHASTFTGAFVAWNLVSEEKFLSVEADNLWQTQLIEKLRQDLDPSEPLFSSNYGFAQFARYERGYFFFLARSVRKYLCGDKDLKDKVDKARSENKIPNVSPEVLVGSGGLAIGVELVKLAPVLSVVGAPVIAGLVLILYMIGMDAFCQWTSETKQAED